MRRSAPSSSSPSTPIPIVVRLHFRGCALAGEPRPLLGQQMRWVPRASLTSLEFPAADRELIDRLVMKR